jgi:tight adherence protein C
VREDLAVRLERIHSGTEPSDFRVRQATWAAAGFVGALLVSGIARPPISVGLLMLAGGPLLGFLVVEQNLSARSAAWQRRITLELPVVSEQLAMLLGSGYSLGAALNRLASRGTGACATDLRRVCGRIRQGLSEHEALREWAAVAGVPALDRLVSVLALNRQATDLGRLVTQEARSIRRDLHREVVAVMERRSQQVWIPVTVATLVPGVVFLCIPFIEALRQFTGS